jgi:hypothetical protein
MSKYLVEQLLLPRYPDPNPKTRIFKEYRHGVKPAKLTDGTIDNSEEKARTECFERYGSRPAIDSLEYDA